MKEFEQFFKRTIRVLYPFQDVLMQFCEQLSERLFSNAASQRHPECVALAFWLRRSHLEELKAAFQSYERPQQRLVPRGAVFHIAPANVETMFVYSWILSLLVGNANIVRLPSKQSPALNLLFKDIQKTLDDPRFEDIKATTCLLSYGHEENITAAISESVDVRILWGGDATINKLRQYPLQPSAKELTFADRFAYSAIYAAMYLKADEREKMNIVRLFYNDMYWYDQQACSSPRAIFWCGSKVEIAAASEEFYRQMHRLVQEKKYVIPLSAALQKETNIYNQAVNLPFKKIQRFSNELAIIELDAFDPKCRLYNGWGLLYHAGISALSDLAPYVSSKDQTLTYYGWTYDELAQFAEQINGQGLDRIVPIGQALNFDYLWDGYNLLLELTKSIKIC